MKKMKKSLILLMTIAFVFPMAVNAKSEKANNNNKKGILETILNWINPESEDIITVNDAEKKDYEASEYLFKFDGEDNRYIVLKKTSDKLIVWTEKEISEEDQAEFIHDFIEVSGDTSSKAKVVEYRSGEGTFDMSAMGKQFGEYTFEILEDGSVKVTGTTTVSHATGGTYINKHDKVEEEVVEPEVEYEWKEVGREFDVDSATGLIDVNSDYHPTANHNKNWFWGQTLDFTDTNEIVMNIQAGKDVTENSTVGTITITKDGNKYTIKVEANDKLPSKEGVTEGTTTTIKELNNTKIYLRDDGQKIDIKGPGDMFNYDGTVSSEEDDGKKIEKAKEFTNHFNFDYENKTFTTDSNKFDFMIHFNVDNVTYELVQK